MPPGVDLEVEQTTPVLTAAVPQVVLTPAFPPLSAGESTESSPPRRGALRIALTWTVFGLVAATVITATTLWSTALRRNPATEATIAAAGVRPNTTALTGLTPSTPPTTTAPAVVAPPTASPTVAPNPDAPVARRTAPSVAPRRVVVVPRVIDPPAATAVVPVPVVTPAPVAPTTTACGDSGCPTTAARTTKRSKRTADANWDPFDDPYYDDGTG